MSSDCATPVMTVGSKKNPVSPERFPPVTILADSRQVRDLVAHGVEVIDVVERAVEGIRIGRRSGAQLLGVPDEGFDELIVDGLVNDHASGRGAILAAVEERCLGDAGGGLLDVDVAEDDHAALCRPVRGARA